MEAQFIYYDSDRNIKFADFLCDPNSSGQISGPPIPLDLKVGDGPVCLQRLGNTMLFSFRVGRVSVQLRNYQHEPTERLAGLLTPIALGIAANLAGTR